jgi:hypothetical protein
MQVTCSRCEKKFVLVKGVASVCKPCATFIIENLKEFGEVTKLPNPAADRHRKPGKAKVGSKRAARRKLKSRKIKEVFAKDKKEIEQKSRRQIPKKIEYEKIENRNDQAIDRKNKRMDNPENE